MILLKKVRLINWYGFTNVTAPICRFTLIAGKNGNGKSVMLDAIKYAAYGDTVFNKSSESKGSRTLSSYTRGLLDATAGTYMRPAEKAPNVYSHIVLEYFDQVEEKAFLLGTVIETSPSNNCQAYRYVMDRRTLDQVEHTYTDGAITVPYSASGLQKRYRLTLLNREQGIPRFMQMTGLKLNMSQVPVYLRKLRGIMSYDPDAKVDRFIRESVLEERNVDFTKLIEAKENIGRLTEMFNSVEKEIGELDAILAKYDAHDSERKRLLTDDIKLVYLRVKNLREDLAEQSGRKRQASERREEADRLLRVLEERERDVEARLLQAKVSLQQLDSARMIVEEERRIQELTARKKQLAGEHRALTELQGRVNEILGFLLPEGVPVENKTVLASLCGDTYSPAEKEAAVSALKGNVNAAYEEQVRRLDRLDQQLSALNEKLAEQTEILEECRRHRNSYDRIPEYVGLRDEINREFAKRKLPARAQFACEYVLSLRDEDWRDAIEAFLGPRRYTILVEPQYYDIADDVLNRSAHRYAHLFNTKLLMRKKIQVEEDSAVHMLDIKNPMAQQYFNYQLGRMHAVPIEQVREYENAISREGRVSVAMDSYFLRLDQLRFYYLGQETFELNRIGAERAIRRLKEEKQQHLSEKKEEEQRRGRLAADRAFFKIYNYSAAQEYQTAAVQLSRAEEQLWELKRAQASNREYLELSQMVARLEQEQQSAKRERSKQSDEKVHLESVITACENRISDKSQELKREEAAFHAYELEDYSVVQRAVEAYEHFLANGKKGPGGLLAQETRSRVDRSIKQYRDELVGLQSAYRGRAEEDELPIGVQGRERYADRRSRIWMDDLQEIRRKLGEQTRRYEDIFKNEFVLTILKSCDRARDDLKEINRELARLSFAARYQFDVHYVRDGSDYARIIDYARYLDEREQRGETGGQMVLGPAPAISDQEGARLEEDLKGIINRIIEKNSEETIARFADYRNYMTYEILISNQILDRARLSRQTGFNSGAEVQIPYILILTSALLIIYNQRVNSTRLVFIDEPFAKMDPGNVQLMLDFMRSQNLQVIFCSPDKTESIGNACEVILPVLRVRADSMQLGIVQFHEEVTHGAL